MSMGTFAVIDVETTGLFPGRHHRVAEIAVVKIDRTGQIVDRWETLVNPGRDLGKQSIHGIRAAELLEAPTFKQIALALRSVLAGSVLVAHNLNFDARFLEYEFHRAGLPLPVQYLQGLCTMRLAHHYVPGAGRSLQDCCDAFSIELKNAHCAAEDAHAAAQLLGRYIDLDPHLPDWDEFLGEAAAIDWQIDDEPSPCRLVRRRPSDYVEPHFLERIMVRLPEFSGPVEHEQYLALLDRALLDRQLSVSESNQLVAAAEDLGIGRHAAMELHASYVQSLVVAAWQDGIITREEEHDLRLVAKMLAVTSEVVSEALSNKPVGATVAGRSQEALSPGDLIVLTGEMERPRPELENEILSAGYIPHSGVTKKVKMLVAADPDSQSGKARKARSYGIPVVGEAFLLQLLGI